MVRTTSGEAGSDTSDDVFDTGLLDDRTRELMTVPVLDCLQALLQLKAYTAAALGSGRRA